MRPNMKLVVFLVPQNILSGMKKHDNMKLNMNLATVCVEVFISKLQIQFATDVILKSYIMCVI